MKPKAPNEHEDGLLEYLEDIIGTSKYKEDIEKASEDVDKLNDERGEKLNRVKIVEREKAALEVRFGISMVMSGVVTDVAHAGLDWTGEEEGSGRFFEGPEPLVPETVGHVSDQHSTEQDKSRGLENRCGQQFLFPCPSRKASAEKLDVVRCYRKFVSYRKRSRRS